MNKAEAKQMLKTSGKTKNQIEAIYKAHMEPLGYNFTAIEFSTALNLAFSEAAGVPSLRYFKGPTVNAVAVLMDGDV